MELCYSVHSPTPVRADSVPLTLQAWLFVTDCLLLAFRACQHLLLMEAAAISGLRCSPLTSLGPRRKLLPIDPRQDFATTQNRGARSPHPDSRCGWAAGRLVQKSSFDLMPLRKRSLIPQADCSKSLGLRHIPGFLELRSTPRTRLRSRA